MTQEEYDNIQERLSKGYDLRQTIARIEKDLNTMLDARKQTANYLPEITLRWQYMYNIEWLEISEDTKRKIMDLVTDDLVVRLEQLKKQFEEL